MTLPTAILLGIIQALTEFFPVSSSGHLALAQTMVPGFGEAGLFFDIWLHLATAAAILVYYRKDLADMMRLKRLLPLGITTGVTGGIGLLLHGAAETILLRPAWVSADLAVTGILLLAVTRLPQGRRTVVKPGPAALIGLAQGLAVFPGLSRSGFTLAATLGAGIRRDEAARYSFLASVPVILLASVYEWFSSGNATEGIGSVTLASAFAVTFLSGLAALHLFIPLVRRMRLHGFALYCIMVAGGSFLIYGIG